MSGPYGIDREVGDFGGEFALLSRVLDQMLDRKQGEIYAPGYGSYPASSNLASGGMLKSEHSDGRRKIPGSSGAGRRKSFENENSQDGFVFRVNPSKDLPVELIQNVLQKALDWYRTGVIKIKEQKIEWMLFGHGAPDINHNVRPDLCLPQTHKFPARNPMINPDIQSYNDRQAEEYKLICDLLANEICRGLPDAENKIWHAHPV